MPATYKDIQRLTGLSLSTISKYFNNGGVKEANRKAIQSAIQQLDFRVNEFARGLKSRRSRTVGILIPELNSTFHTTIISETERVLRRHGYGSIICDCHLDEKEEGEALRFLLDKMVDGIITIPYQKTGIHLEMARHMEIPVVLIDRLTSEFKTDAVIVDNAAAGSQAVGEFVRYGHQRIAMIGGPQGIYTMQQRTEGFRHALEMQGIPLREEYCVHTDMTTEGGYAGAQSLFALPEPPTALYCANYEITLGFIIAANEREISVPKELSVIGFDNLLLSGILKPHYSVIAQPMNEMATHAAQLLLERMSGEDRDCKIVELPTRFVQGQSIAVPNKKSTAQIPFRIQE